MNKSETLKINILKPAAAATLGGLLLAGCGSASETSRGEFDETVEPAVQDVAAQLMESENAEVVFDEGGVTLTRLQTEVVFSTRYDIQVILEGDNPAPEHTTSAVIRRYNCEDETTESCTVEQEITISKVSDSTLQQPYWTLELLNQYEDSPLEPITHQSENAAAAAHEILTEAGQETTRALNQPPADK